ncbi:MAG TPA: anti-sigma factor [Chitinophagales bacterium]|nr:anti-sigma factor [Chitinophagales bacterium]HRK28326.1 anti-sigma factor [Chitinophagales bacterium]
MLPPKKLWSGLGSHRALTPSPTAPFTFTDSRITMVLQKIIYPFTALLLAFSLLANAYFYDRLHTQTKQSANVKTDCETIKEDYELLKRDLDRTLANLKILKHPDNKVIQLTGTPQFAGIGAVVIWNATTKAVYIDAALLPQPPGDKQYQVWAVNKDVYKSLGVFNRQPDKETLYRLTNTEKPDAFAVSLELPQGSPTNQPTQIYATGKMPAL